jgi:hypothetical protein
MLPHADGRLAAAFLTLKAIRGPIPSLESVGEVRRSQQGQKIMKTLFYILKKDGKGPFRWVEAVNDIDTAEARVRQLCAESRDEYLVFRNIDLRVVATYSENTYKRL